MNEEIQANYYAIIPAGVRYNKKLKFAERLMYGEITALSNSKGYCFAKNKYFADLYNVSMSTISRWISHLSELRYIDVDLIRNEKKEIIERRIYILDTPYTQNNQYPYMQNGIYPICKKSKDNIINNNMIDSFFDFIINNKEKEIPKEFSKVNQIEIFNLLSKYEMLYTKDTIGYISNENLKRIKDITYTIALIVKDRLQHLSYKVSRDKLIQIYNECKQREEENINTDNKIENFINYYYKSIVNQLTRERDPSFFMPKKKQDDNLMSEDDDIEESEDETI